MTTHAIYDGFSNTELQLEPYDVFPIISDDIQQTLSRLMGWDAPNKRFMVIRTDVDGRLLVSSSPTKSSFAVQAIASVTVAITPLLAENPDRKSFEIQNKGGNSIELLFSDTLVFGQGILVSAGGFYSNDIYTGAVWGIAGAGSNNVLTVEY